MKKIVIKDNYGKDYEIKDIEKFKNHLTEFHSENGEGDNSLHEENGRYFTITKDFFNKINNLR